MGLFGKKKTKEQVVNWGSPGHLDDKQTHALKEFQAAVAGNASPGDDEHRFCQFLRARKFDVAKASQLYLDMVKWRREFGADGLLEKQLPHSDEIHRFYPHTAHKFDKLGRPVFIESVGAQNVKRLVIEMKVPVEEIIQHHVRTLEQQRELMKQGSAKSGHRVVNIISILDLSGATLKKNLNSVTRDFVKQIAFIGQNMYPESLGKMYIINAPSAFGIAWRFVKPFLDKRTQNKIEVVRGNPREKLLEFIAEEDLPKFLGGTCECPGGCVKLDAAATSDTWGEDADDEDPEADVVAEVPVGDDDDDDDDDDDADGAAMAR